jgi:hypothetical protein
VPPRSEVWARNMTISREKALGVCRGGQPLHVPLPLTGRLMGVLCAVIQIPLLPMLHTG